MTKTELQIALAAATSPTKNRRSMSSIRSATRLQSDQKERRIRLARCGKLVKQQEEEGPYGLQSQDATEDQDSS